MKAPGRWSHKSPRPPVLPGCEASVDESPCFTANKIAIARAMALKTTTTKSDFREKNQKRLDGERVVDPCSYHGLDLTKENTFPLRQDDTLRLSREETSDECSRKS